MSDSRISWGNNGFFFDYGEKVFASKNSPDIFGYCGDVLFPLMILSQVIDSIDFGVMYEEGWNSKKRQEIFIQTVKAAFDSYPHNPEIFGNVVEILHCTRDDTDSSFHCYQIMARRSDSWKFQVQELNITTHDSTDSLKVPQSFELRVSGSGQSEFIARFEDYKKQNNNKTSRSIYQTFCNVLSNIQDKQCGGAPQLVGLIRKPKSCGISFGILYKDEKYFQGMRVNHFPQSQLSRIEWRNELFERIDPNTARLQQGAKSQPFWK